MPGEPERPIQAGILSEYALFLRRHKMWWTLPTAVIVLILAGIVLFSADMSALDIYAVF